MLKRNTIQTIQNIAKLLSEAFVADAKFRYTTPEDMIKVRTGRNGSGDLETIKRTIRHDKARIDRTLSIMTPRVKPNTLTNIMKSKEQFDFFATEILAGIKREAWSNKEFKPVYDKLFSAKRQAPVQSEFQF